MHPDRLTTMRDLMKAGLLTNIKDGVKLISNADDKAFRTPINFEVSFASAGAIRSVEAAGGTITCVHFNKLALRALVKPHKFKLLPRRARPSPKIMEYYLDKNKCGYLSPEIQLRNLKKFGHVTSEANLREEHEHFVNYHRAQIRKQREAILTEMKQKGLLQ